HGSLALEYANGRQCWLEVSETDSRIVMLASIEAVHANNRAALLEAALRVNADTPRTDHGVIGYDEDRRELILTGAFAGAVDAERLAATLASFIQNALKTAERLDDAVRAYRSADAPDDDSELGLRV